MPPAHDSESGREPWAPRTPTPAAGTYGAVGLRPVSDDDLADLTHILAEESVARWWLGFDDEERVRAELIEAVDTVVLAIVAPDSGSVMGAIQYEEERDPDYRYATIDLFLGTAWQGQGFGPAALRAVLAHLFAHGHQRAMIDPAAANERAIRAYRSVGFRDVGIMRRYERGIDGSWRDALLLDILAEELR